MISVKVESTSLTHHHIRYLLFLSLFIFISLLSLDHPLYHLSAISFHLHSYPMRSFNARLEELDEADRKPVMTIDGVNYVYIKHNNLMLLAVTRRNANIMVMLLFFNASLEYSQTILGSSVKSRSETIL